MALSPGTHNAEAYVNQANILKEKGMLDEAATRYRQALTIKPDYAEAYGELGNVLKEQGQLDRAIANYRQALLLKPDYAKVYINLGVIFQEGGLLEEAAANYNKALAIKSDYVAAHFNLGALYMSLGLTREALQYFRQAIAFKPDLAQAAHMIAVLEGKTTQSAPHEYIKNLFNHYAANFEHHLVEQLGYAIPQVLFQNFMAMQRKGLQPIRHAIDLGCGTGLNGELFCTVTERLTGVDLSDKMLEVARKKRAYNALYASDIETFLDNSEEFYDLFLATDVFVYVGDLQRIFAAVQKRSLPGAHFAFSTESAASGEFVLRKSARYAHSREYIHSLCDQFGFQVELCKEVNIRKDQDVWVRGELYILQGITHWQ